MIIVTVIFTLVEEQLQSITQYNTITALFLLPSCNQYSTTIRN